jgi:hypothetical protein
MADFNKLMELDGHKRKRRPPESERYDELKGKRVQVIFDDDSMLFAVLQWVAPYTLGLRFSRVIENGKLVRTAKEQVWITNKAYIVMIGEA